MSAASSSRAFRITKGTRVEYGAVLGEVLTAVVTPFDAEGSVDYDRFRELARHLFEHGSDGLVVAGTTGESPTLSDDERVEHLPQRRQQRGHRVKRRPDRSWMSAR